MGWSVAKSIDKDDNHYDESKYNDANASWFQKSWWSYYDWGWIYTNDTQMPIKLTKATFNACAGHSNNKYYDGGAGRATLITYGHGCNFTSDIYVVDASGNAVGAVYGVGNCRVEPISQYNCYYGGYGNVCTDHTWTSFGNPAYFSGNRAWHPIPITYDTTLSPAVPPGGKLMVVIRPTAWFTSSGAAYTGNSALLVMKGDSSNFTSEFEPEDQDYIWRLNEDGTWKKERRAFMMTNLGWEEMKEI